MNKQLISVDPDLSALPIAILVVVARFNRMKDIEPLAPDILKALNHLPPKSHLASGDLSCH